MLSYLLLLSAFTAHGIKDVTRSTFLEDQSPEAASDIFIDQSPEAATDSFIDQSPEAATDSFILEGMENDSSQPVLAQTETKGYVEIAIKDPDIKGYRIVEEDSRYKHLWGSQKDARKDYFACGMRGRVHDQIGTFISAFEVIYCNRYDWTQQYKDPFDRSVGYDRWNDLQMCPEGSYIYGFWWIESENGSNQAFEGLGFWCNNFWTTARYVLDSPSWIYRYHLPRKQWYNYNTDVICGFQAQISTLKDIGVPRLDFPAAGIEGFAIRLCKW
jgi:hypothetical protein